MVTFLLGSDPGDEERTRIIEHGALEQDSSGFHTQHGRAIEPLRKVVCCARSGCSTLHKRISSPMNSLLFCRGFSERSDKDFKGYAYPCPDRGGAGKFSRNRNRETSWVAKIPADAPAGH